MSQDEKPAAAPVGKSLLAYLREYRARVLLGVFLLLATNALDKSIPWLLQHAIDALLSTDLDEVRDYALIVIVLAAGMWTVRSLSRVVVFNIGRDIEFELRNEVLDRIHMLGSSFFAHMPTGNIMSRATSDLAQVRLVVGFGLLHTVNSIFAYAGAVALMTLLSPELTLWALAPYPLFVVIAALFSRALYKRSRESQEALGLLADRAQESIAGVRLVRSVGMEEHEERRFDDANQNAVDKNMRLVVLRGLMWPVLMSVGSIGTLIVIWKGGQMVLDGQVTVGQFAAFLAYLGQLIWPTLAFGYLLSVIQRGRASYARVREIIDATPDIEEAPDARQPAGRGALSVRGLDYSYGELKVLDDVSFDVPAGGSLAVVGTVGSGKSTLAALLPRLLPAPRGTVFLDGDDVTELALDATRRAVGYAQQEPFLFSTTIRRNIAFALDDPDAEGAEEVVRAAAEEAAVLEEIESLPDGFATLVGERGVQLSGGQKQRLTLARALLNEPTVLVLDDPLSAVDAKTENKILGALDRAGEGRTLILVTHRTAAAAHADSIVVLERGAIVERGTHDELVEAGGLYARMAARQRLERELSTL